MLHVAVITAEMFGLLVFMTLFLVLLNHSVSEDVVINRTVVFTTFLSLQLRRMQEMIAQMQAQMKMKSDE